MKITIQMLAALIAVLSFAGVQNIDTIITSWISGDNSTKNWPGTVQVFEVTPERKIVWALLSWDKPDPGPAISTQILEQPGNPNDGEPQ